MTDKERLLAFLDGADIPRTDVDHTFHQPERSYYVGGPSEHDLGYSADPKIVKNASSIRLGSGIGYGCFFVEFFFDEAGALTNHGVWE